MSAPLLILASKSPRRKELLERMGLSFIVDQADIEETETGEPGRVVAQNALEKALRVREAHPDAAVLGADTVVWAGGEVFGKPRDEQDAERMLRTLSGAWHEVYTGVALLYGDCRLTGCEVTRVHFVPLRGEDIRAYIQSGEPFDKAGAYAVQGRAGMFVDRIEGSYSNVIGLPQTLVREFLIRAGLPF